MDWENVKINLQTYYLKIRSWTSFVASLAYIALFLSGVYMLATAELPVVNTEVPPVTAGELAVSSGIATVGLAVGLIIAGIALMFRSRTGSHTVIGSRVD